MTIQDPNTGRYVNTDRDAVKRGDQNFAVIGPARLETEEEVQQQVDKGISSTVFNASVSGGKVTLGSFAPGYWHTSKYLSGSTVNGNYGSFQHSGLLYPIFIGQTSSVDALAIYVVSGLAGTDTTKQAMRMGIYNEVNGLPYLLIAETNEFNPADGSIADNTFYVESLGATYELAPGRYWLARKRKYNAIGAISPARAHGRRIDKGTLAVQPTLIGSTTFYGGIEIAWTNDGFTNMPAVFDIADYASGTLPQTSDIARPEIYVRAV